MRINLYMAVDRDGQFYLYNGKPTRDFDKDEFDGDVVDYLGSVGDARIDFIPEGFRHLSWKDEPRLVTVSAVTNKIWLK